MALNPQVRRIFSLHEEWNRSEGIPIAETAFMAGNNVIRNNRQLVEQLLKSYDLSTQWVVHHPDSAADLIVRYHILPDREAAFRSIPQINFKFVRADTIRNQVSEYFNVFYEMNPDIIGGRIPDENFYYR
jgi:NitT/TauT family transport system substrate-binding protein